MGIFDRFSKATALEQIKKHFNFLVSDFGYEIVNESRPENFRAENFLVYRNNNSNIQIEICADESWFHSEIKRIVNGNPANYNDSPNCIGFEDLALLESETHSYDHFDYYVGGKGGLRAVLKNTAALFKRNKDILTTQSWLDTHKILNLKEAGFNKRFGANYSDKKPAFFTSLKQALLPYLQGNGYKLILDSGTTSPFDWNSAANKLVFEKGRSKIEISQKDWRDDYFIYQILANGKKIYELDVSKLDGEKAIELIINKINHIVR